MANNKFESLAYSLHFHSKSNYISANYYEELDQGLTYVSTLATVLGSASGGISLLANQVDSTGCARLKTFANLVSLTATDGNRDHERTKLYWTFTDKETRLS